MDHLVGLNGLYDMLCALCILLWSNDCGILGLLSEAHRAMFRESLAKDQGRDRMMAYWLLTYGLVRACVPLEPVSGRGVRFLASVSYFVEAGAFAWEDLVYGTTVRWKAVWVCLTSIVLGGLVLNEAMLIY